MRNSERVHVHAYSYSTRGLCLRVGSIHPSIAFCYSKAIPIDPNSTIDRLNFTSRSPSTNDQCRIDVVPSSFRVIYRPIMSIPQLRYSILAGVWPTYTTWTRRRTLFNQNSTFQLVANRPALSLPSSAIVALTSLLRRDEF